MNSSAPDDALPVTFYVYSCTGLTLRVVAERLRELVRLPLAHRRGVLRGDYYRWSGDDGADLLLQRNVLDEDGQPVEPDAPAHAALVYATGLPSEVDAALSGVEGLSLLAAEVVTVPRTPRACGPRQPASSL